MNEMLNDSPRVALIHATPTAIPPARIAFAERFPRARLWNLVDDRLVVGVEAAGELTRALRRRMESLIQHAVNGAADAILMSCAAYAPVALDAGVRYGRVVLPFDQALLDQVTRIKARRVVVLGPTPAGVDNMVERLRDWLVDDYEQQAYVSGVVVEDVREAMMAGDRARVDQLIADEARWVATAADAIALSSFSIARSQSAVQAVVPVPVLSPVHLAAELLCHHFAGQLPRLSVSAISVRAHRQWQRRSG